MDNNLFHYENIDLENKLKKILFYCGDYIDPLEETVNELKLLINKTIKIIFNFDAMQIFVKNKSNNSQNNKIYNKNFKRYLLELFPKDVFIFKETTKYKKILDDNNIKDDKENFFKKLIDKNKSLKNQIMKYKEKKYKFNLERVKKLNNNQTEYFEKCKETKLCTANNIKTFYFFIQKYSHVNIEFLKNDNILILVGYIINIIIKKIIKTITLDTRYELPLKKEDLIIVSEIYLDKIKKKVNNLINQNLIKFENKAYKIFLKEYKIYLDSLFIQNDKFLVIKFSKNDDLIEIQPIIDDYENEINNPIHKNKKIKDIILNPEIIWKNWKIILINSFIERYIIYKKIKLKLKKFLTNKKIKMIKLIPLISKLNLNSKFFFFINQNMNLYSCFFTFNLDKKLDNSILYNNILTSVKKNLFFLFKRWFYTYYLTEMDKEDEFYE